MNRWDSIKELTGFCERLDFVHLHEQRKSAFVQKVLNSSNVILITCVNVHKMSDGYFTLCEKYGL